MATAIRGPLQAHVVVVVATAATAAAAVEMEINEKVPDVIDNFKAYLLSLRAFLKESNEHSSESTFPIRRF